MAAAAAEWPCYDCHGTPLLTASTPPHRRCRSTDCRMPQNCQDLPAALLGKTANLLPAGTRLTRILICCIIAYLWYKWCACLQSIHNTTKCLHAGMRTEHKYSQYARVSRMHGICGGPHLYNLHQGWITHASTLECQWGEAMYRTPQRCQHCYTPTSSPQHKPHMHTTITAAATIATSRSKLTPDTQQQKVPLLPQRPGAH